MANLMPFLTTAPRVKIKINQKTIAFAIGMNASVNVRLQPVNIVGKFGPVSIEPTYIEPASLTMQVLPLAVKRVQFDESTLVNYSGVDPVTGNETFVTGQTATDNNLSPTTPDGSNPIAQQRDLTRHMDPRSVLLSKTFDIELYLKIPNVTNPDVASLLNGQEPANPINFNDDSNAGPLVEKLWLKIQDCRLTSRSVNISQGNLTDEPISVQGLLVTPYKNDGTEFFELDSGPVIPPTA